MTVRNKYIDSAILIAILTGGIYAISYVYQLGYLEYYHLPPTLIDLSINKITGSLTITLPLIAFMYLWLNLMLKGILEILRKLDILKKMSLTSFKEDFEKIYELIILFAFILSAFIAGVIAEHVAANKTEYIVLQQDKKTFVVVTTYNDNLIIAPLDVKKGIMTPNFKAIEIKSLKNAETINFMGGLNVKDVRYIDNLKEKPPKDGDGPTFLIR